MANQFVTLEEAAKLLGISTDALVAMRSSGAIRAFKDGTSWKFNQTEIDRLLAEGPDNLGDEGSSGSLFGSDLQIEPTDDGSHLGMGSELSALEDLGQHSGSDLGMIGSLGESGEDLLSNMQTDSAASALDQPSDVVASSGSQAEIVAGLGGSEDDMILNIDSDSNASLLNLANSDEDLLSEITSQSDVLSFDESSTEADESPSAAIPAPSDESLMGSQDGGSQDDLVALSGGSASGMDIFDVSDSSADAMAVNLDDSDVDLSMDLSLDGEAASDAMEVDLSLAEKALSDPSDIDLSMPEPSTGGSDQGNGIGGEDPSDLGSDINFSDSVAGSASQSVDAMSDLDLMSAQDGGSADLISGASGSAILGGSDLMSPISGLGLDDDDDDNLVISDNDDDLLLEAAGSDISVIGGSGINLMSPSDSGLSLESEPLDLAGSSISALDLSGDASDGTPGSSGSRAGGSSGSLVDFKADEEFQLSPGGLGLDMDDDSASQVIEVEDSQAFSGAMEISDAGGWDQQDAMLVEDDETSPSMGLGVAEVAEPMDDEGTQFDTSKAPASVGAGGAAIYEVPFSVWNVLSLVGILLMLCAGGVISADLMRNLWTESANSAPVSSLTETLLKALGMDA